MQRYTVMQFNEDFPDEDVCLDYIAAMVYPDFPAMPCRACEDVTKHHRIRGRKAYSCQKCGTQIYPLAGTIFEKSRTPLRSWFYGMYLMASTRSGISAKQLERELGVTYKTAWRMFKQMRSLLDDSSGPLKGTVEIDETFYGGRPRHRQGDEGRARDEYGRFKRGPRPRSQPDAKKPIVGMVERDGDVRAFVGRDYLQTYVNEYAFRYNHRDDDSPMFRTISERVRAVLAGKFGDYAPLG